MSRSRDIANLLGPASIILQGAPSALDTLNELAAAINNDASFATTITNSLAGKLDAATASAVYTTLAKLDDEKELIIMGAL